MNEQQQVNPQQQQVNPRGNQLTIAGRPQLRRVTNNYTLVFVPLLYIFYFSYPNFISSITLTFHFQNSLTELSL
jgi:hypothetical protein